MSLNNEQYKTRPFLNNLNSPELKCQQCMVILDKCNGSCNTFSNISNKICVPNKTEDVNLSVNLKMSHLLQFLEKVGY